MRSNARKTDVMFDLEYEPYKWMNEDPHDGHVQFYRQMEETFSQGILGTPTTMTLSGRMEVPAGRHYGRFSGPISVHYSRSISPRSTMFERIRGSAIQAAAKAGPTK